MRLHEGSAAIALQVMPKSAVRGCVLHYVDHLTHALELARIAVHGPEPERAARYIVDTVDDLSADLRTLRVVLRTRPPN